MYDTIIIGAGIAGLSAGRYLHKKGQHNFAIFESAYKIGGRIQTVKFGGKIFSSGPGWVHGKKGNPIYDILVNIDVPLELGQPIENDILFVWDTDSCQDITELFNERVNKLKNILEYVNEKYYDKVIDPEKNFKDLLMESSDYFESMTDLERTVLYTCMEIYRGAPLHELSALAEIQHDEVYDFEEGILNFRIVDPLGGLKLINYLCKDFKDQIKLKHKVKAIDWSKESEVVKIVTDNDEEFHCKNVIITLPSELLARESIKFLPKLPIEKLSAWKYVPGVNYCRLFAKFPTRFWPEKEWLIQVIKNVDPVNELIFWQNCACQNLCAEDDNILICHFTSGSQQGSSRFDVEKEELTEIVTESMKRMFPHTYCAPSDVLFITHWDSERFSGSFSKVSPGISKVDIEELCKSVGPLHFAGESVIVELIGTMQGAYISGIEAAKHSL